MQVLDYAASFVTFCTERNNARLQVEARCILTGAEGRSEQFLMFASCKSEDTYGPKERLFTSPNYDFSGIFGDERFCIARIRASSEGEQLEAGPIIPRFQAAVRDPKPVEGRPLLTPAEVVQATLDNRVIIARNELTDPDTGRKALLEYPVKTMNVLPSGPRFQVDTGPVPLYDFASRDEEIMARFLWAYVAFNDFTSACFVIQEPTPLLKDGREVARSTHYSRMSYDANSVNTLFAVGE